LRTLGLPAKYPQSPGECGDANDEQIGSGIFDEVCPNFFRDVIVGRNGRNSRRKPDE
jgi:hypothetical protein